MQWMATVFAARMRWKRQVLREAPGRQGVHQSIQQIQLPFGNQTWHTWGIFHQAVFDCRRYLIHPRRQYLGLVWSDLLMGTYQLGTQIFVDQWCSNDLTWFDHMLEGSNQFWGTTAQLNGFRTQSHQYNVLSLFFFQLVASHGLDYLGLMGIVLII